MPPSGVWNRLGRRLGRLPFHRVYWPLFVLAFLFIAGVMLVLSGHLESGASRVNAAGRQRMYIQQMAKEALVLSHTAPRPHGTVNGMAAARDQARTALERTLKRFQRRHRQLLEGGDGLRRVTDAEARDRLKRVGALWRPYRDTLRNALDGPMAWAQAADIVRRSHELQSAMDAAVERLERVADARTTQRRILAFLMLGGLGILLALGVVLGLAHQRSAAARDRLYRVIQEIPDLVFYKDENFYYIGCNRAFATFVNKTQAFIEGATDYDLFDRDTADFFRTMDRAMLATGTSRRNEEWVRYPDGTWVYLDMLKAPLEVATGRYGVAGLGRDITVREETRASRDRLLTILEATPDFVGIADPEGAVTYLNPGARRLLGLDATHGTLNRVAEAHPPWALRRLTEEGFPEARRHGFWQGETAVLDSAAGTEIPVSQIVLAHYDTNGEVTQLSTIARDIRDQKRAEAALREAATQAESVANSLIDTLPGVFFLCDTSGTLRRWNQALETVTGHDSASMRAMDAWSLFTPAHRGRLEQACAAVRDQGSGTLEADLARVDGEPVRYFFSARALELHGTTCITMVGMDISTMRRLEAERERLAAIIEATPDFVGIATPDGRMVYRNPGARALVGDAERADGLVGGAGHALPEWASRRVRQEGIPAARQDGMWWGESALLDRNGEEVPVSQIILAHNDETGALTHLSTIARDIRDQKQAEAAVRRSNEELESFAYAVSHDLQEPLRLVVSYVELMHTRYADVLDDRGRAYLGHALDSARRMRTMIRDLLEYSRVQTQGSTPAPVAAGEAAQEALDNLEERRHETGAEIHMAPLPVVLADRGQLVRVFQNLVGNALKYHTAETTPRVRLSAEPAAEGEWLFTVADNGPGIPDDERERVFGVFHRGDNHTPGTGIGLSLVRRIVERHGGTIWVETAPEGGSAFCFTLPGPEGSGRPCAPTPPAPTS